MSEDFKIVDGVYKGPKHYPDSLYLRGTPISDLGSLESVGGRLDLGDSSITSLGSLKSVGGHLNLWDSSVADLGSLKSVGGWVFTQAFNYLRLQDLKDLIQEIEDSSIATLVERLPIEKDPFLKRVMERRIYEV